MTNSTQIYAVNKSTGKLEYISANLLQMKEKIRTDLNNIEDYYILQDISMKYISRITYVDGKCIYNNSDFWTKEAIAVSENFDEHVVLDFMNKPVTKLRFETERNSNSSRITAIDGKAGQVLYNIEVGQEFISNFREECIDTDFETVKPLEIAQKLLAVISLVQTGSFREAKAVLKTVENDEFLTEERIQKYIDMLDAADSIEYATEENHYDKVEETEEPAEEDK